MLLDDKSAAIKLQHDDGVSFEVWWYYNSSILAISHSPNNYPSTIVHTMNLGDSIQELNRLLSEGWQLAQCSEKFSNSWHGK